MNERVDQSITFDINHFQINSTFQDNEDILTHIFYCQNVFCDHVGCDFMKLQLYHRLSCDNATCTICIKVKQTFESHSRRCRNEKCIVPSENNLCNIYAKSAIFKHMYKIHQIEITPLPIFSPKELAIESPTSPIDKSNTSKILPKPRIRSVYPSQIMQCKNCGKKRTVPDSLDLSLIPNFECNLNIWDGLHNSCSKPEEINRSSLSLEVLNSCENYEKDKEEFMEKLKQFHRDKPSGLVVRTPTLGKSTQSFT